MTQLLMHQVVQQAHRKVLQQILPMKHQNLQLLLQPQTSLWVQYYNFNINS